MAKTATQRLIDAEAETVGRIGALKDLHDDEIPLDKLATVLGMHCRKLGQQQLSDAIDDIILARVMKPGD